MQNPQKLDSVAKNHMKIGYEILSLAKTVTAIFSRKQVFYGI
jgi:hypothetical protein